MLFTDDEKFLIAISVHEESTLAVFDLKTKLAVKNSIIRTPATNKIVLNPNITTRLEFMTIGAKGSLTIWNL